MDWADLPIIDISKASTPEGRAELATQVRDAMRTFGFLYVVNHGYTQAQVLYLYTCANGCLTTRLAQNERLFDVADVPFSQVSDEEKMRFSSPMKETGSYKGYKLRQLWVSVTSFVGR